MLRFLCWLFRIPYVQPAQRDPLAKVASDHGGAIRDLLWNGAVALGVRPHDIIDVTADTERRITATGKTPNGRRFSIVIERMNGEWSRNIQYE